MKVLLAAVLITAFHDALEDREVALDDIGEYGAAAILTRALVYATVAAKSTPSMLSAPSSLSATPLPPGKRHLDAG